MSRVRGLELLFNLQRRKIRSKSDCAVIALHCMLIDANLQCLGIGKDFCDQDTASSGTELLPEDWNECQEEYLLRYMTRDSQNRCLMNVISSENILDIDIVVNEEDIYGMSIEVDQYITDEYDEYNTAYQRLDELINAFHTEILEKIHIDQQKKNPDSSDQQSFQKVQGPKKPPDSPSEPRTLDIENPPNFQSTNPNSSDPPKLPKIGNQDRDPLGRGQGGMHFDPGQLEDDSPSTSSPRNRRPKTSVPPNVPPGARFDPFGPTKGPNKGKPNPDHFKPPDADEDDIF